MRVKIILGFVILGLVGCGGSSSNNNDDTDNTNLATNFETAAGGLVPLMTSGNSSISKDELSAALTYGADSGWSSYTGDSTYYVLTDVFGDPNVSPAVVTKIRVLLDQFASRVGEILSTDALLDCTGATAFSGSDEVTIAFYGSISNGTSSDRYFDCLAVTTGDNSETLLYGQDSSGIIRVVQMSDNTSTNTEETGTRGDESNIKQVVYTTFQQTTESGSTVLYIDLQYTQASIYNGVDGSFTSASDNVVFKSRSRITGRVVLSSSSTVSDGEGDFTVTKYDQGVNQDSSTYTEVTQTMGRGQFATGQNSIFQVDSTAGGLSGSTDVFCIQQASSGTPTVVDSSNCTAYETAYVWSSDFPFTLLSLIHI